MTDLQWSTAVKLWNEGKSLGQISAEIGIPVSTLMRGDNLVGAVMSEISRRIDIGEMGMDVPVRLGEVAA